MVHISASRTFRKKPWSRSYQQCIQLRRFFKANKPQTESCHVVTVRHGAGLHGEEGGGEADAAVTELMNNDNMKSILHGLDKGDR